MRIYRIPTTKAALLAIPKAECQFLLGFGHATNEIMVLQKVTIAALPRGPSENEIDTVARITQATTFVRMMASKLLECWRFVEKAFFKERLGLKYNESLIGAKGMKALTDLKAYFSGQNMLQTIRDQYGFHYDKDSITANPESVADHELWEIFCSDVRANNLYYVAEAVANHAMFRRFSSHSGDRTSTLVHIVQESTSVANNMEVFATACWKSALKEYFKVTSMASYNAVEITGAPKVAEFRLPFFYEQSQ